MSKRKKLLRLPIQEQVLFAKRLAILVKAGVPLLNGLRMLQEQTQHRSTKKLLTHMIHDVEEGQFLSTSIEKFGNVFGEFAINIIRVGETSGTLEENLHYLAEELKKKQALRRKVIGALVYPLFIVVATFIITAMLTVYIFPKILPIFASFKFDLPWSTRALIFISDTLIHHWILIISLIVVAVVGAVLLLRLKTVRLMVDRTILSMPVLGNLSRAYHMSNFCRTLGILLKTNVMIVEATTITARTTSNKVYQRELNTMVGNISKGERISDHMNRNKKLFPAILAQMVTVGESTGNLSETLMYLAEMYENEVDDMTKNLSTLFEPALMVFMGAIVGFIAISIITPIYEITQHLHP